MCTSPSCGCGQTTKSSGGGWLAAAAIADAVRWFAVNVLAPALAIVAIVAWRWFTGAPMLRRWTARARLHRLHRAALRLTVSTGAVATYAEPVAMAVIGCVGVATAATTYTVYRWRTRPPGAAITVQPALSDRPHGLVHWSDLLKETTK
jgi:hypothetical protein